MTVRNVRLRFCTQPLCNQQQTQSLGDKPTVSAVICPKSLVKRAKQVNRPKRALDGEKEAQLVALVCSPPPEGANRWTLQLVKDRLIEMQVVENIGKETIRRTLKKTNLNRGTRSAGAFHQNKTPDS
jgi:hypothetical protein